MKTLILQLMTQQSYVYDMYTQIINEEYAKKHQYTYIATEHVDVPKNGTYKLNLIKQHLLHYDRIMYLDSHVFFNNFDITLDQFNETEHFGVCKNGQNGGHLLNTGVLLLYNTSIMRQMLDIWLYNLSEYTAQHINDQVILNNLHNLSEVVDKHPLFVSNIHVYDNSAFNSWWLDITNNYDPRQYIQNVTARPAQETIGIIKDHFYKRWLPYANMDQTVVDDRLQVLRPDIHDANNIDTAPQLTIGMATYDDFHGVYFSIQALRMYHDICNTNDVQLVVVDNNPDSEHGQAVRKFMKSIPNGEYHSYTKKVSSYVRDEIFKHALAPITLCIDCHVMLDKLALPYLIKYFDDPVNEKDMVSGPMINDDLKNVYTQYDPVWNSYFYGTWYTDPQYKNGVPFEITVQGAGLFACKTEHWPGFCQHAIGFGGGEGYIQEKFRKNGGKTVCIPQLKWLHRFPRPGGAPYPVTYEDRLFNFYVGWLELYEDLNHPMILGVTEHFSTLFSMEKLMSIRDNAMRIIQEHKQKTA